MQIEYSSSVATIRLFLKCLASAADMKDSTVFKRECGKSEHTEK